MRLSFIYSNSIIVWKEDPLHASDNCQGEDDIFSRVITLSPGVNGTKAVNFSGLFPLLLRKVAITGSRENYMSKHGNFLHLLFHGSEQ